MVTKKLLFIIFWFFFLISHSSLASFASYNTDATHKVVYDVKTASMADFINVLDRISYLNTQLGDDPLSTSIIVVLHGDEINYFGKDNELEYQDLVTRVKSLGVGDTIEFRVCNVAARRRGFAADDLQSFIKVVPMADAEIVQLQFNGYAYMR